MAKKTKVVDVKMVAKKNAMEVVGNALTENGYEVLDGVAFGMTAGTVIARKDGLDIQIKPITPKAGVNAYEVEAE